MSFGLDFRLKSWFFDTDKVIQATTRAERKNLSKAGAFVRRNARQRIRYAKKAPPNPAGGPPKARVPRSAFGLHTILFAYQPWKHSVIVGPVSHKGGAIRTPAVHEHGLTVTRKVGRGRKLSKVIAYPKRPYMAPALEEESPKFPDLWRNSVI